MLNRAAHKAFENYSYNTAGISREISNPSKYQPGGTVQLCTKHSTGRIMQHLHDPRLLGRWSGHKFRLKGTKTLLIITGYRPCKESNSSEDSSSQTVHRQQSILLQRDGSNEINPRKAFIKDIIKLLTNWTRTLRTLPS
jgi:hypothetical protein